MMKDLEVVSDNPLDLKAAVEIAFRYGHTAVAWMREGNTSLTLFWSNSKSESTPLPFGLGAEVALELIRGWLEKQDYPRMPNTDGSCKKGFSVLAGSKLDSPYAIFTVKPEWIVYGK